MLHTTVLLLVVDDGWKPSTRTPQNWMKISIRWLVLNNQMNIILAPFCKPRYVRLAALSIGLQTAKMLDAVAVRLCRCVKTIMMTTSAFSMLRNLEWAWQDSGDSMDEFAVPGRETNCTLWKGFPKN
jgi:hypothetical protein